MARIALGDIVEERLLAQEAACQSSDSKRACDEFDGKGASEWLLATRACVLMENTAGDADADDTALRSNCLCKARA